jgi:hypothetical protein
MNEINELVLLYDYYGELLSESQRNYFEDYYFNNLSLSEIADNLDVSRNAVHKQIKVSSDKLYDFEKKLKVIEKTNKIKKIASKIEDKKIQKEILDTLEN